MTYYVYVLKNTNKSRLTTYVGYTKNLKKRLKLHNEGMGAKFTRGRIWKLIYYKKYTSKNIALKEEYKLKKNYRLRNKIKKHFFKNDNISSSPI